MESTSKTTPHLLDELVKLTSIRDAELLEISLLRTLQDILHPPAMSLFRLSGAGDLCYQMVSNAAGELLVLDKPHLEPEVWQLARAGGELRSAHRTHCADGREFVVFPVVENRGFTTFLEVETRQPISDDEGRLIDGFLRFYANYCSLLDYSQRDQLTGLMNRKTFDESIYKLFSHSGGASSSPIEVADDDRRRPERRGQFWLGMLDIDHFKRINDGFGHLYGDEVLLLTAQIMRRTLRDTDLLFRFGGEEFVAITQNADRDGARAAFGRLRDALAAHRFPQIGQVTASFGVVQLVPGHLTPILLDKADKALYWAKENGRNRVAIFEDLLEQGLIKPEQLKTSEVDLF